MKLKIFTDGGARGNPGPGAVGVVVKNEEGEIIAKFGQAVGIVTNNVAEYQGVVLAFEWLKNFPQKKEIEEIVFFLDSQLVVSQLNGFFKVKNAKLREFIFQIRQLEQEVGGNVSYRTIPREENKEADFLVNQALDKEG